MIGSFVTEVNMNQKGQWKRNEDNFTLWNIWYKHAAIKRTEENYISEHPGLWCMRRQVMLKAFEKKN